MILGKFWSAIRAQINKIANVFWEADPIAQMQYEHDTALEQLKEGRKGLEMYRGLVERVDPPGGHQHRPRQEARGGNQGLSASAGNRETAAKFALELQKAKKELEAASKSNCRLHEAPTRTTSRRSSTPAANSPRCARTSKSMMPN